MYLVLLTLMKYWWLWRLQALFKIFLRFTASAQSSPCESTEERRVSHSASRSTLLKRTRTKSTQNIFTQPPARSKSSRSEGWCKGSKREIKTCVWLKRCIIRLLCSNCAWMTSSFSQCDLFQPKGADRKQKTDREKMEKRAPQEKEKYQPSYETTILTEVF